MNTFYRMALASVAALVFSVGSGFCETRPNIILFYVDDLGWQDVERLNDLGDPCPYETPNLVRLAEMGMNLSQAYSPAPTCAPSRAGVITGQHPAKLRFTHVTGASIPKAGSDQEFLEPFLGSHLDLDQLTLADALRRNGYRTGHYGKWHNGLNSSAYGFDSFNQTRGMHRGMDDRTKDFATADDKRYPLSKEKYFPYSSDFPNGISYPKDELTEEALKFISDNKEEPFFLNLCHWMVHWPVLTRNAELLEYYCKKMGQPFPPEAGDMTLEGQQNPYFAAMVTSVDWSLGRVMDLLETTEDPRNPGKKLIETTYLIFTSDNGGAEIRGKEIISDNFPLKHGKKYVDEGGIRVPLVAVGPGIPAGTEVTTMVNQLDFFPTFLTLTSSEISIEEKEKLNGLDISPVLFGESDEVLDETGKPRESLFWHFPHNSMRAAIRKGDFKFYRHFKTGEESLYRLYKEGALADLEEEVDLVSNPEYDAIRKELAAELDKDLAECDAELPHRNPKFKGAKLPYAKIKSVSFGKKSAEATLTLEGGAPKAARAYALYYSMNPKGDKKSVDYRKGDPAIRYEVKIPAVIAQNGYEVSVSVPKEVSGIRFLIIDENDYQLFSELTKRE